MDKNKKMTMKNKQPKLLLTKYCLNFSWKLNFCVLKCIWCLTKRNNVEIPTFNMSHIFVCLANYWVIYTVNIWLLATVLVFISMFDLKWFSSTPTTYLNSCPLWNHKLSTAMILIRTHDPWWISLCSKRFHN